MNGGRIATVLGRTPKLFNTTRVGTFHRSAGKLSSPQEISARINAVHETRVEAGKMVAGVAAYSDSDMFKDPQNSNKPNAKRWDGKKAYHDNGFVAETP
jgi:hypothetical protein